MTRQLSNFALSLVGLVLLAGCSAGGRGGPVPYNVENFGVPDAPTVATLDGDYKIAPLDKIKVSVFQVPDLSGEFLVDLTGNISLPLVGNVKAVDMTAAELDQRLTQQLGAKYLQNPDVSVGILESTRRNVTVEGAVRNPGVFPVNGPTTLIQVIALAKGTEENANPRRVAVFRQIDGKTMAAAFDLVSIRRGEMENPRIYTGDIVVVDGSNLKEIQKQVLQSIPLLGLFRPFG